MYKIMICKDATDIPHLTEGKEYNTRHGIKEGFIAVQNDAGIWVAVWKHRFIEREEVVA